MRQITDFDRVKVGDYFLVYDRDRLNISMLWIGKITNTREEPGGCTMIGQEHLNYEWSTALDVLDMSFDYSRWFKLDEDEIESHILMEMI